ncbi:MAG: 4Fe-4S dicluster domain-containing protein [Lachnospiraceae bacterium]|nr:4Fe-4S dicluster domain-containing protein [Lachnospiraceae bacterium]
MLQNDKGIVGLKHRIMEDVARLAWEDKLDVDNLDKLVEEIIPGPRPEYRCCVYKEREIVRQRIRLAMAKNTKANKGSTNEVQVIKPACDECSIAAYTVTDNCRLCLGKPCMSACKFGAISQGEIRTHIDATKCKECGLCAKACPFGAIVHLVRPCKRACPVDAISFDEHGFCHIDEEKCINCGHCIHNCPFGAIGSKTYLTQIIAAIKEGKEVYAMCAPAAEGQFGEDISMKSIKNALIEIGFKDMVEVGLGGDMTAAYEAAEWTEAYKEGKKMTTSCCPAFINMLKKHFPEQYKENMSSTVSPMCAVSRYLKYLHPDCITVFVGPCIAKKTEAKDENVPDNADYVITFGELLSLFKSAEVELKPVENDYQEASIFGKKFAGSGGVAAAVIECMQERGEDTSEIKLQQCAGGIECKKALTLLKVGKLPADFIEGMICVGGCVGGPSNTVATNDIIKSREKLFKDADERKILANLENYPMDKFSMHRDGHMD